MSSSVYSSSLSFSVLTISLQGRLDYFLRISTTLWVSLFLLSISLFFFFFFLFPYATHVAACVAYAASQARGQGVNLQLQPQQHRIWATSVTYTTALGNTGYLTHWARPGMEPASSWTAWTSFLPWASLSTLIRFLTAESQWELLYKFLRDGTISYQFSCL